MSRKRCQQLEEVLLQQQLKIEQVGGAHGDGLADSMNHADQEFSSARRAKSVPAHGDRLAEPMVSCFVWKYTPQRGFKHCVTFLLMDWACNFPFKWYNAFNINHFLYICTDASFELKCMMNCERIGTRFCLTRVNEIDSLNNGNHYFTDWAENHDVPKYHVPLLS